MFLKIVKNSEKIKDSEKIKNVKSLKKKNKKNKKYLTYFLPIGKIKLNKDKIKINNGFPVALLVKSMLVEPSF